MRGGVASGTGLMMMLDMPEGLLDDVTAALMDPGHVPGN